VLAVVLAAVVAIALLLEKTLAVPPTLGDELNVTPSLVLRRDGCDTALPMLTAPTGAHWTPARCIA
jgi:hypothetical protein